MRIFWLAALLSLRTASADPGTAPPSAGWIRDCESKLREAAATYRPESEHERWQWKIGDGSLELRYESLHAELDYQITVTATSQRSHPWRTQIVRNPRVPEVVDEWVLTRVYRGRVATFRAAGMAGLKDRDSFLKVFRPALDACFKAS